MDLERLNKALSTYEVAEHIFKVDNGKTLSEALILLEAANAERAETNEDELSLKNALKNVPSPRTTKPKILMGVNKTRVVMNGKPDAPSKRFSSVVNSADKEFNRLTREDAIDNHRSAVNGELPWKKRNVSASMMKSVKNAAAKSRANVAACQSEHGLNLQAEGILSKAVALKEVNNTPAARSIVAHGTPSERSVKDMLPPSWRNSDEVPSLPVDREIDTRNAMPDEFRPKITPTVDKSFGAVAARTKAAATISRPVASKAGIDNPETNAQGEIADKYWPYPKAAVTKQAQDKTNSNRAPRHDVSLRNPKKPAQQFDPIDGAI
jgi:hypothetical protein